VQLVEAIGCGVKFTMGTPRDDVQSWVYRGLRQRRQAVLWALRDVTFVGMSGDIIGIVGANGAGKTTLCRALARLIQPDAGRLTVRGTTSALLSLGTGFNRELTGRENILLNGLMLGLSRREITSLLPRIAEFADIGTYLDQPLKLYSTGMKARLGFSIGAMIEPDLLILDETLSTGDLDFSARAAVWLKALIDKARLVIVVTHRLAFVEAHCSRVLWLDRGTVHAIGPPREVVPEYRRFMRTRQAPLPSFERAPAPSGRVMIGARNVTVRFRVRAGGRRHWHTVRALDDLTLTLEEGEILGVIGPNGAGKSTLCRVLRGVIKPDEGCVDVNGRLVALLALTTGFNLQLPGRENIFLNGLMLGMSRRYLRTVYADVVRFSGLARVIDEPVKHYSTGMRSRLGFSTAAMLEPDILIIDETLSAGDATFREKAALKIRELMARARAVIVVTHDLSFVEAVCTRALCLHRGRIMFDGSPSDAIANYRRASTPELPDGRISVLDTCNARGDNQSLPRQAGGCGAPPSDFPS